MVKDILMGFSWSLQVITVPFNMASGASVTLRVGIKDGMGFDMTEVRVAVKIPLSLTVPSGTF